MKDLLAVSSEIRKQFRDLTTVKRATAASTHAVQVNELAGIESLAIDRDYGDSILRNDEGLIVAHHSLPLRAIDTKVGSSGRCIRSVLDSRSEIIAMPKRIWEELGLPIRSDHTMRMSSANASIDSTIGVLENIPLDFGGGVVMVQVQILARTNFDLLLGRPFHCHMTATTEDFPDGSQTLTLRDPNTGKQFSIPTRAWSEGCPRCRENKHCNSHNSVVEMGF